MDENLLTRKFSAPKFYCGFVVVLQSYRQASFQCQYFQRKVGIKETLLPGPIVNHLY